MVVKSEGTVEKYGWKGGVGPDDRVEVSRIVAGRLHHVQCGGDGVRATGIGKQFAARHSRAVGIDARGEDVGEGIDLQPGDGKLAYAALILAVRNVDLIGIALKAPARAAGLFGAEPTLAYPVMSDAMNCTLATVVNSLT